MFKNMKENKGLGLGNKNGFLISPKIKLIIHIKKISSYCFVIIIFILFFILWLKVN